jgi:hypothetical protein
MRVLSLDTSSEAGHNASAKSEMTFFTAYDSGLYSVKPTTSATTKSNLSLADQKSNAARSILQTPFPTEGSDSGVFKLGTSRPLPDTSGQPFSPVPFSGLREMASSAAQVHEGTPDKIPIRGLRHRTSSRALKENMRPKASLLQDSLIQEKFVYCGPVFKKRAYIQVWNVETPSIYAS